MTEEKILQTPLKSKDIEKLTCGDKVILNGTIYTARDAAHKRLCDLIEAGKEFLYRIIEESKDEKIMPFFE